MDRKGESGIPTDSLQKEILTGGREDMVSHPSDSLTINAGKSPQEGLSPGWCLKPQEPV